MLETKGLRVPVIAVTAYTGRREELLTEGFEDILPKPIDPKALCGVVRRHAAFES
jgi:CheY-like chemotaxis protein